MLYLLKRFSFGRLQNQTIPQSSMRQGLYSKDFYIYKGIFEKTVVDNGIFREKKKVDNHFILLLVVKIYLEKMIEKTLYLVLKVYDVIGFIR